MLRQLQLKHALTAISYMLPVVVTAGNFFYRYWEFNRWASHQ